MNRKVFDQFSFELRQFRLANGLSRAGFASVLGISASTMKDWEDGTATPRTYKLWEVYDRLQLFAERQTLGAETSHLLGIFDELIDRLKLANVDEKDLANRDAERKLSKTILKASQTDFGYLRERKSIVPIPFTEDLELFRNTRIIDIEQLLQSIVATIEETIPNLSKANLNDERLVSAFNVYRSEAERDYPNPRILHRKGEIIRRQIQDVEVRQALSSWDTEALDGFVSDHQELMRLYFGSALVSAQEVENAVISDAVVDRAAEIAQEVIDATQALVIQSDPDALSVDARIPAILVELKKEIEDYEESRRNANSPQARNQAEARIKTSVKHIGIFLGRFIIRATSIAYRATKDAGQFLVVLEVLAPGSFRTIYAAIRQLFPALPPLP